MDIRLLEGLLLTQIATYPTELSTKITELGI